MQLVDQFVTLPGHPSGTDRFHHMVNDLVFKFQLVRFSERLAVIHDGPENRPESHLEGEVLLPAIIGHQ